LDNLWKHGGRRKALVAIVGVCKVGELYMNKDLVHANNESMYANVKKNTIASQVFHGANAERKKKLV
jgi:hypothetical protein